MKKEIKKYTEKKLIVFNVNIDQKQNKKNIWKKNIKFPKEWTNFNLENSYFNDKYNGLAMLTGKKNNIAIIDVDNIEHWNKLLIENNQIEPTTVKVISGSGGIHYYFTYDDYLDDITSKDHCFGKNYDIDIKINGGCIICHPTNYFNNNLERCVF
jgi:hypothetical protein